MATAGHQARVGFTLWVPWLYLFFHLARIKPANATGIRECPPVANALAAKLTTSDPINGTAIKKQTKLFVDAPFWAICP